MVATTKIAFRDSSFVVGYIGEVVVAITEGDATLEAVDAWGKQIDMIGRAYPGGVLMLFVVGESAVVPSGPGRARANELFKSMKGTVRALSTAIEGVGFASATKRAAFTLISQGAIRNLASKVHGDVDSACAWLTGEAAKGRLACPPLEDLKAAVRSMPRPG
jgi:hypothetical protein